jgi:hypothetical protein
MTAAVLPVTTPPGALVSGPSRRSGAGRGLADRGQHRSAPPPLGLLTPDHAKAWAATHLARSQQMDQQPGPVKGVRALAWLDDVLDVVGGRRFDVLLPTQEQAAVLSHVIDRSRDQRLVHPSITRRSAALQPPGRLGHPETHPLDSLQNLNEATTPRARRCPSPEAGPRSPTQHRCGRTPVRVAAPAGSAPPPATGGQPQARPASASPTTPARRGVPAGSRPDP